MTAKMLELGELDLKVAPFSQHSKSEGLAHIATSNSDNLASR